jgi:hypothetical protein
VNGADSCLFRLILRKEYRRAVGTHYGQTRIRKAAFSLCRRRDGRAGTTILQLVLHPTAGPRHFPSDYGPAGLLEQGQRRRIRRSRRTVLRDYGPKEAASSRRRAVGTTGPFKGPLADREQRTPPSTPPGPQYPSGTMGRDGSTGRLCRSTPQQADDMTT